MRKFTLVMFGAALMLAAGCTAATEPAREDTTCRGYNVSSGRTCK